jgi:DNA-binding winged helix-turn-helix (wHTH) protein
LVISKFPLDFRKKDVDLLAKDIENRRSLVLLGIKRVGIGVFLSYFINKNISIKSQKKKQYLYIPVDLHDLVECELSPFWTLTLKRIVDAVDGSEINEEIKKEIRSLFLESIQLQDLFFTIDSVRLSVKKIIEQGFLPTLFFIRFDRLKNVLTPEFFANLEGLRDFTHQQLSYIFTSYVEFKNIFPNAFIQANLSVLYKNVFIKPAEHKDCDMLFEFYKSRYDLHLDDKTKNIFLNLTGGHFQYLQLGLFALHGTKQNSFTEIELKTFLINDERIRLQSEELWECLSLDEQKILMKIISGEPILKEERISSANLWSTGFVKDMQIFNPLFEHFIKERISEEAKDNGPEFSKKELLFFEYLKENINNICEREEIVEKVWPEASDIGISDWAIDKLAARVRTKLNTQSNNFEIQTIKTRGFKLIEGRLNHS